MIDELKNIHGALSRIKQREKASSFQLNKNLVVEKSPIKSVSQTNERKSHLHSKSEITTKKQAKSPPSELFKIDEGNEKAGNSERPLSTKNSNLKSALKMGFPRPLMSPERAQENPSDCFNNGNMSNRSERLSETGQKKKGISSIASSLQNTESKKAAQSRIEELKALEIEVPRSDSKRIKAEGKKEKNLISNLFYS